jgi:hypothetical protein
MSRPMGQKRWGSSPLSARSPAWSARSSAPSKASAPGAADSRENLPLATGPHAPSPTSRSTSSSMLVSGRRSRCTRLAARLGPRPPRNQMLGPPQAAAST